MSSGSSGQGFTVRELLACVGLLAVWFCSGGILWLAATVAGGHPTGFLGWPVVAVQSFLGSDRHQFLPWHWVGAATIVNPATFWAIVGICVALLAIPAVLGLGMWRGSIPVPALRARLPQHATWGSLYNLANLIVSSPGQLGRLTLGWRGPSLLAAEPGASTLVFGPTQSGKTSGLCIPAILEWQGPVVAISIKRDLIDNTAGWRQRRGRTMVYDPVGATDLPSMRWTPITGCADFDAAWRMGDWLSSAIDKGKGGGDSDWAHWRDAARRLLASGLYAADQLGASTQELRAWIDDGSGESLRHALSLVPDCDPAAIEVYQSIQERPERERGSCYSTAQRTLSVFLERKAAESAEGNDLDPKEFLLTGENTLYLVAPLMDQERLQMLFIGIIKQIVDQATRLAQKTPTGRIPQPLLLVLDELANTAPIERLPQFLSTGYSQGITVMAIFQDMAQIRTRYQDQTETIINNSRAKVFLSGIADMQTLQLASQLVGQERHRQFTYSSSGSGDGHSYTTSLRQLLPPEVARQLRPGSALLLYHYLQPAVLAMRPWFKNRELRRRAATPYIPEASRIVA
ncbi:MAG TPA: type IV secretory system conjugative DNA transfer family protein [Candidatus Dormibacteraeota bacterium]|jgi:type IV secretion system protein VirD4|nr:type IV secretory system conjugative DNA transfer family protein [Candidatus Dormibacteraeota bacterium]